MTKFFSLLALLSFSLSSVSAAGVTLNGKVLTDEKSSLPEKAFLISYGSGFEKTADTAIIDKSGKYEFALEVEHPSLFNLTIGTQTYKVLLSPAETSISITNTLNSKEKYGFANSKENLAYRSYIENAKPADKKIFDAFRANLPVDSSNLLLRSIIEPYFDSLALIQKLYPQTFTATVLCKIKLYDNKDSILKSDDVKKHISSHYLDNLVYNNENLLRESTFNEMILGYFINIIEPGLSPMKSFIDRLSSESKDAPRIFTYALRQLFQHLTGTNKEDELIYLAEKSINDQRLKDNQVLYTQINDAYRVTKGQSAVNVFGKDANGDSTSLASVVKKHKLTLLVFWEPNCSHCKEAMPLLRTLLDDYGSKGFGIFGVSLAEDEEKWKSMVDTEKLSWTNIIMQKRPREKTAASYYYVLGTPTFVLISGNGKIARRFIGQNNLEDEIKKLLQ